MRPRAEPCSSSQAWNLVTRENNDVSQRMDQHPKVTLQWALRSLEKALQNLGDGRAERRVRRQFHQLLLAVERDGLRFKNEVTDSGPGHPDQVQHL